MNISDAGLALIKEHEGLRLHAYQDSVGAWTIGVGHTLGVYEGQQITTMEADRLLRADLETAERCVNGMVHVEVSQNQFDALVSFAFNVGCGALRASTLLRLLNDGDDMAAAQQFEHWCHAGGKVLAGLVTRREAEKELFLA